MRWQEGLGIAGRGAIVRASESFCRPKPPVCNGGTRSNRKNRLEEVVAHAPQRGLHVMDGRAIRLQRLLGHGRAATARRPAMPGIAPSRPDPARPQNRARRPAKRRIHSRRGRGRKAGWRRLPPRARVVLRRNGPGHAVLVEHRLVSLDTVTGIGSPCRPWPPLSPPLSLATTGMPRSMASMTMSPKPSYQSEGMSRTRVLRSVSSMPCGLGKKPILGSRSSARRSFGCSPTRNRPELDCGSRAAGGRKMEMPFTAHGLNMVTRPRSKWRKTGTGGSVDGRMDHRRGAAQPALEYSAMCAPMVTTPAREPAVPRHADRDSNCPGRRGRTAACGPGRPRARPLWRASRNRAWPRSSEDASTQSGWNS